MDRTKPLEVATPTGKVILIVMDAGDLLPASFALTATQAAHRVAVRIAGGCKGMSLEDKIHMFEYFETAFRGFRGMVMSGATRQLTSEGLLDPMVTDIPGFIVAQNPGSIALGTAPRTAAFNLTGPMILTVDKYGTVPNPTQSAALYVQNGPDGTLDWNGDVAVYIRLMEHLREYAGFTALGLIVWNGGAVTKEEALTVASKGWPVFIVQGSGRIADELAADASYTSQPNVHIVSKNNPDTLRQELIAANFIRES